LYFHDDLMQSASSATLGYNKPLYFLAKTMPYGNFKYL